MIKFIGNALAFVGAMVLTAAFFVFLAGSGIIIAYSVLEHQQEGHYVYKP